MIKRNGERTKDSRGGKKKYERIEWLFLSRSGESLSLPRGKLK